MLYIFHVDTGTMMTFDMKLALESVNLLKEAIERMCKIPADKQVLLVSGGECLDPSARVCSYSAGTDTNPIYLFSKSTLESTKPPSPSIDYGSDSDMTELVDQSLNMPATYSTVVARAHLAQQFCELAREHTIICEGLVHDQHLQQQGWAAAVANLEDITAAFKAKSEMFQQSYKQHLETREENLKLLQNFSKDLQMLARIPILQPLMGNALSFSNSEGNKEGENKKVSSENETTGGSDKTEESQQLGAMTLLMWISTADNQSSLEQVAEQAQRGLEQFDETVLESLNKEVEDALETSNKTGMKEIKGLEERLFGLEQLMVELKKVVQEQSDLAQAFHQNQNRVGILNDASILPDLCSSHRKQLLVMLQNQHKLRDIRRRCSKAKEELSVNLYHRLGWVMYVENLIVDVTNKLMIYHENLKRLRRYLEITKQVQRTPQVYVAAVSEVVRRRTFSQAFLSWASDLSCRLLAIYNEESERRKDFQSQFEGHFLQSLFPGFEDNPPPFATQAPAPFDVTLPQLTVRDMEQLKEYLPELSLSLSVTKLSTIAQMFLAKSISEAKSTDSKENVPVEDRLVAVVSEVGLSSKLDETLLQPSEPEGERAKSSQHKDDRDFESETDTEEFEKVCQSPVELGAPPESKFEVCPTSQKTPTTPSSLPTPPAPVPPSRTNQEFVTTDFYLDESMPSSYSVNSEGIAHPQVAMLQENLGSARTEVEVLRYHLTEAGKLANEAAIYLKTELVEMRIKSLSDREEILALVKDIQTHIAQLTKGYSEEIDALHKKIESVIEANDLKVQTLNQVIEEKEKLLNAVTEDMNTIRNILEGAENEKQGLTESLTSSQQQCQELKIQLEDAIQEKINAVQSVSEQLSNEFKIKINQLEEELNRVRAEKEEEMSAIREKLDHDHQAEIEEMKSTLIKLDLDAEIDKEKSLEELEEKLKVEHDQKIEEIRKQLLEEAEMERQKAVKEASEKLAHEYKIELENLRSRFRLMSAANMEKSPSDSSLEKIERLDMIELANHEAIISQIKEDAAVEKEKAVHEALKAEREKLKQKLEEELKLGKMRMEEEKQIWLTEAVNRAVAEKNSQIDSLILRQESLITECQRHRDTIRLLTDGDHIRAGSSPGAGTVDPLLERIDHLEREKMSLINELDKEKRRKAGEARHVDDMSASVAVVPVTDVMSRDAATSPEPSGRGDGSVRDKLTKSTASLVQQGKISITSCSVGDAVLVIWNVEHANYTILQETATLFFLHSDCLDSLGLRPSSDGSPRRLYSTAQVVEKEYCHAKKSENRYRVPKGTKFYRVKVRPLPRDPKESSLSRSHHQQQQHCQHLSRTEEMSSSQQFPENSRSHMRHSLESGLTSSQLVNVCTNTEDDGKKDNSTSR